MATRRNSFDSDLRNLERLAKVGDKAALKHYLVTLRGLAETGDDVWFQRYLGALKAFKRKRPAWAEVWRLLKRNARGFGVATVADAKRVARLMDEGAWKKDLVGYVEPYKGSWLDHDHNVDLALGEMNEILGGFGIEYVRNEHIDEPVARYINNGDSYTVTIVYDESADIFEINSWGGWLDSFEQMDGAAAHCAACDAPVYPPESDLNDDGLCEACAEDE